MIKSKYGQNCKPVPCPYDLIYKTTNGPQFEISKVICVSGIYRSETEFPSYRGRFIYRVSQSNLSTSLTFVFNSIDRATQSRKKIVLAMLELWGPDSIIFANGFESDAFVITAIRGISHIDHVDCNFIFNIELSKVEHPITARFLDVQTAIEVWNQMNKCIENVIIEKHRPHRRIENRSSVTANQPAI